MDQYFPDEEEAEETGVGAPQVDETGSFAFQSNLAGPSGGFSFGAPAAPGAGGDSMAQ
jgi:hypothetical protein